MQVTQVRSLGQEDPLENEMATHSTIQTLFLSGEFPGQRSQAGCNPWDRKELDTTKQLTHTLIPYEQLTT